MYITDARHFLDDKGAMASLRGPAKAMADFHAGVIAYATDFDDVGVKLPRCFKCKKATVQARTCAGRCHRLALPALPRRRAHLELARHALGPQRSAGRGKLRSEEQPMGIGCRRFIVEDEDKFVRLKNTLFERLLRDPKHHTMPALAGQRVRMAEILVPTC